MRHYSWKRRMRRCPRTLLASLVSVALLAGVGGALQHWRWRLGGDLLRDPQVRVSLNHEAGYSCSHQEGHPRRQKDGRRLADLPADFPRWEIWRDPAFSAQKLSEILPFDTIYLNRDFGKSEITYRPGLVFALDLQGRVKYWARHDSGVAMDFKPHYFVNCPEEQLPAWLAGVLKFCGCDSWCRRGADNRQEALDKAKAGGQLKPDCYSYFVSRHSSMVNGNFVGETIILDDEFQPVQSVALASWQERPERACGSHDFLMFSPSLSCLTVLELFSLPAQSIRRDWPERRDTMDSVVQLRAVRGRQGWRRYAPLNGVALDEWRSSSCRELYNDSAMPIDLQDDMPWDYSHINSIFPDVPTDGIFYEPTCSKGFLFSFRYLNEVVKVQGLGQPGAGSPQIVWVLGGEGDEFGLTEEQKFSQQHTATRTPDGGILVFDNGEARGRTRLVKYWLDEENRRLRDFKEIFVRPDSCDFSTHMGSVFEMAPDTYLVSWGGAADAGLKGPDVSIIYQGHEIWTLTFKDTYTWSYRAYAD